MSETYGLPLAPPPVIAAVLKKESPASRVVIIAALTKRHPEPLGYVASAEDVAGVLGVSPTTVRTYRRSLERLGV